MYRTRVAAVLMLVGLAGGAAGMASASYGPAGRPDVPPPVGMTEPAEAVLSMARVLKLTDAQKEQIKAVLDSERSQAMALMDSVRESRDQLMQAGTASTFDEAAVRALATAIAPTEIELTVIRTRTMSRINSVLTAEQRELLKNLRPEPGRQPPPPPME